MAQSEFVGVDNCSYGWVSVGLNRSCEYELEKFASFCELLKYYAAAKLILVDMPIGLPAGQKGIQVGHKKGDLGGRHCDWEARKLLGSSWQRVFLTPTRFTVDAATQSDKTSAERKKAAYETEFKATGAKLTPFAFSLVKKIHEVDSLLPRPTPCVREVHPEICFWALNGKAMISKHKAEGIEQRICALRNVWRKTDEIIKESYPNIFRGFFKGDDLLDALVAAITAYQVSLNPEQLRTLPANPPPDAQGSMEMVYWVPPRKR